MTASKAVPVAPVTFTMAQVIAGSLTIGAVLAGVLVYVLNTMVADIDDVREWQKVMAAEQANIVRDANASATALRAEVGGLSTAVSVGTAQAKANEQAVASLAERLAEVADDLELVQSELQRSGAQDTAFQQWAIAVASDQAAGVPLNWIPSQATIVKDIGLLPESPLKKWNDIVNNSGWR